MKKAMILASSSRMLLVESTGQSSMALVQRGAVRSRMCTRCLSTSTVALKQRPRSSQPKPPKESKLSSPPKRLQESKQSSPVKSQSQTKEKTVVVLGGGITGLASAVYLSRNLTGPRKIILLEKDKRLGGWVHSERRSLPKAPKSSKEGASETALLEAGPRSIRPTGYSGLIMLDMVRSLGLWKRMIKVPKTAPSARNRFIWYPDRLNQLPSGPSGIGKIFSLPVMKGIIAELMREFRAPSRFQRPKSESAGEKERRAKRELIEDESVESFLTRRTRGTNLARNLISAVIHGIYAGDIRKLSVRALLPFLWESERVHGGLMRRLLLPSRVNKRYRGPSEEQVALKEWEKESLRQAEAKFPKEILEEMKRISVYSFPEGLQEITKAMEKELREQKDVEVRSGVECHNVTLKDSNTVEITTSNGTITCDRVISSLPSSILSSKLQPELPSNYLNGGSAATVGVVNVAIPSWLYAPKERLLSIEGFGFLVPRSVQPNEDGILGVVFDSDSLPGQDLVSSGAKSAPTKFTVMMGGAHWQNLTKEQLPSPQKMAEAAKKAISKCLDIDAKLLDNPSTLVTARMQYDCIPWYTVGHPVRMAKLHQAILNNDWRGKLTLVGASYTGVSLNDCVARAGETMQAICDEAPQRGKLWTQPRRVTGLEVPALQCGML